MEKITYIITNDPRERCELVSSVFSQALISLSFGYECDVFLLDNGVRVAEKGYIDGLKADAFGPLSELVRNFKEMDGRLFVCNPAAASRNIRKEDCIDGVDDYVNAPAMIESAKNSAAVFTF